MNPETSLPSEDPLHCDIVVVGAGVLGLFSAIAAAKRGRAVILVDQFDVLHSRGSSHGDGRIYRLAYSEPVYLNLMSLSIPLWKSLSVHADDDHPLMVETGFLMLERSVDGSLPTKIRDLREAFKNRGITHDIMSGEEASKRFDQFSLSPDIHAMYIQEGGVLFAARCMRAAIASARSLGVKIVTPFRATRLQRLVDDSYPLELTSDAGQKILAQRCILAPGAWLSDISGRLLGVSAPTFVSAESVSYFSIQDSQDEHKFVTGGSMPVFIMQEWYEGDGRRHPNIYGLPIADVRGVKVAAHYCGPEVSPDARPLITGGESPLSDEVEDKARQKVEESISEARHLVKIILPGLDSTPFRSDCCLYTRTSDCHLILDSVSGWDGLVVLAGGGSGHGFKLAPGIGECAAAMAIGEEIPVDVGELGLRRLADIPKGTTPISR